MPRIVRCGLIQARNVLGPEAGLPAIKKDMLDKHAKLIAEAGRKKVKALCLQELFYGPYFCAEQEARWYHLTEPVPDGPTVKLHAHARATAGARSTCCATDCPHPATISSTAMGWTSTQAASASCSVRPPADYGCRRTRARVALRLHAPAADLCGAVRSVAMPAATAPVCTELDGCITS